MIDLSIGVVTYNSSNVIEKLLNSIYDNTSGITFEVIIIDNNSPDNTVELIREKFPQARVLMQEDNKGYGYGHNQAIKVIDSRYHLIVNPDIKFESNVLKELVDYMDSHEDIFMVTPKILNEDGTEQFLPKRKPTLRYLVSGRYENRAKIFADIRAEYTRKNEHITEPIDIEFCTGCFMFVRTEIFRKVGGFDDRFFMYFEDVDLALRVAKLGRVVFNPTLYVTHVWERASGKHLKYFMIEIVSMFKFFLKRR